MVEEAQVIPKTIHYFWFSNDPLPSKLKTCLKTWEKVMPDYGIKKWDLTNTPIEIPFAKQALKDEKWAFLTDYCRLWVLYTYGGIYMDTDVYVVKSFNELLGAPSFWGTANNGLVEPIVIGACPNNVLLKECLTQYENWDMLSMKYAEIPKVLLPVFERKGFCSALKENQSIPEGIIYTYDYFSPMPFEQADTDDFLSFKTVNSYAIHLWNADWFDPFRFFWNGRNKAGWKAIWKVVKKNPFQGREFYRNVFYHLSKQIIKKDV